MTTVLPVAREITAASPQPVPPIERARVIPHLGLVAATARIGKEPGVWVVAALDAMAATLLLVAQSFANDRPSTAGSTSIGVVAAWLTLLWVTGSYARAPVRVWSEQARRVTVAGLGFAVALPLLPAPQLLTPGSTTRMAALLVGAALLTRQMAPALSGLRTRGAIDPVRVVVSGHRRDVQRIVGELEASRSPRYEVVAVCDAGAGPSGAFDAVRDAATAARAEAVLVAPCRHVDAAALRRLGWQLERSHTRLLLPTPLLDVSPARASLAHAGPLSLVSVSHPPLDGTRRRLKEVVDRFLAALGLLALAPVLVVVSLLVRLDSPGPALFRQARVGRNGVRFTMLKFRTMRCDAEERRAELIPLVEDDSILFKLRDDPRTTRFGRFLRRYSMDELPQLVNVLRGDMSLVGPRPPLPEEVARYHPDVHRRLAVKPGITGLWQVSGRSDLSWAESVRLDLQYVDNWSLGTDVGILARTLGAVVHHRGAY